MLGFAVLSVAVAAVLLEPVMALGADGPAEPPAPMSACELFEPDEVAEVIGSLVVGAEDITGVAQDDKGWISICHFWGDPEVFLPVVAVTLASGPGYREMFDDLRVELDALPVAGIGDDAVLGMPAVWGLDQPVGSLHVRVGDTVLGVSLGIVDITHDGGLVQIGDRERQTAILMELAATGLGRMGGSVEPPVELPPICDLLSLEDAGQMVGAALVASEVIAENDDWGPACHYRDADDEVLLFVGLSTGSEALTRFESCEASGQPQPGVGEAAVVSMDDDRCPSVFVGSYFIEGQLVVRSEDTVLIVAAVTEDFGSVNKEGSPEAQAAIARRLLEELGMDPGATPAPIDIGVLEHPCSLATPEEVGEVVRVPITSVMEFPGDSSSPTASCQFVAADGNAIPLYLGVTTGETALEEWGTYQTYRRGDKVPVDGLGDEALSEVVEGCCDLDGPLVSMWMRVGEAVIQLDMGPVERNADYTMRTAGTPDEQVAMLRAIAEIVLTRLQG